MISGRRVRAALGKDLRLQWRQGLWVVYALVCLAYVLVLGLIDPRWRGLVTTLVVFADPAVLGFFFIGGLMLLERGEGSLPGTLVSPLRVDEWMLAKVASLSLLAVVASVAIAMVHAPQLRLAWLVLGVATTSSCFVVLGVVAGTRFSTVNRYLLGGGLLTTPLLVPLLAPLGVVDSPGFALLPTGAALELLDFGLGRAVPSAAVGVRATLVLLAWTAALWVWARTWLRRHVLGGAS